MTSLYWDSPLHPIQYKTHLSICRDSHYRNKTVMKLSYLYHRDPILIRQNFHISTPPTPYTSHPHPSPPPCSEAIIFWKNMVSAHDDVIKWKHFPRYWPFVWGFLFPPQRPVTQSFDVFFDLRLNKRLGKQSQGWWFEAPSHPLWCHCNDDLQCHDRAIS